MGIKMSRKDKAELILLRCGNWLKFQVYPDGIGQHKRSFIDADSSILCFCDIAPDYKAFYLSRQTLRHDRIVLRMSRLLVNS